jgi:nucleotide-binding universal stress UspA family protein
MSVLEGKILLATDGSPEAERATGMAVTLSEKLALGLHVIYVEPMPDPLSWPGAGRARNPVKHSNGKSWRVAVYRRLDRRVLSHLGVPCPSGIMFRRRQARDEDCSTA